MTTLLGDQLHFFLLIKVGSVGTNLAGNDMLNVKD